MPSFSERIGINKPKAIVQVESMDSDLRNGLWNVITVEFWQYLHHSYMSGKAHGLVMATWVDFYKLPIDQSGRPSDAADQIRADFFEWPWHRVYDYVEFIANHPAIDSMDRFHFKEACDHVLSRELSGYRFVEWQLLPISDMAELDAIQAARDDSGSMRPVVAHLRQAASLLADRQNPDFRNSIKESISAVEATCRLLSESSDTLGDCLKGLSSKVEFHPALNQAFRNLYGYTSDSDGIRHALLEESRLDFADAKFMLVACSGFVSYLIGKSAQSGRP